MSERIHETKQEVEREIFETSPIPAASQESKITYIKLRCENCGGTLQTDANHKILCCPYCQSKTLVVNDSPLQVYKEIEIEKAHTYANMSTAKEKMRLDSEKKQLAMVVAVAIVGVIAMIVILGFLYST